MIKKEAIKTASFHGPWVGSILPLAFFCETEIYILLYMQQKVLLFSNNTKLLRVLHLKIYSNFKYHMFFYVVTICFIVLISNFQSNDLKSSEAVVVQGDPFAVVAILLTGRLTWYRLIV